MTGLGSFHDSTSKRVLDLDKSFVRVIIIRVYSVVSENDSAGFVDSKENK